MKIASPNRLSRSPPAVKKRRARVAKAWIGLAKSVIPNRITNQFKLHSDQFQCSKATFYRKLKRGKELNACATFNLEHLEEAPKYMDCRGLNKMTFTGSQEKILADRILELIAGSRTAVVKDTIKDMANQYLDELFIDNPNAKPAFKASNGWVTSFKARHNIPSRRTQVVQTLSVQAQLSAEGDRIDYLKKIKDAFAKYPRECIINLDETPALIADVPIKACALPGKDRAKIISNADYRWKISIVPIVTASGIQLPFAWINKATTDSAISKMELPAEIKSYYAEKGNMTGEVLIQMIKDIILPHLNGRAGVLVMDDHRAHRTDEVKLFCASNNIEIVLVPKGATGELQPLDISFMGPFKKIRQQIWTTRRSFDPHLKDDSYETVCRSFEAYVRVPMKAILKGWRQIAPDQTLEIDQNQVDSSMSDQVPA